MSAYRTFMTVLGLSAALIVGGCAAIGDKPTSEGHPNRSPQYDRPGFETFLEKGKIWVFKIPSPKWSDYLRAGELAKRVTWIGDGPEGKTLLAPDNETLYEYTGRRDGFKIFPQKDGKVWVFRDPSDALDRYEDWNRWDTTVEAEGAGVHGATLVATDRETLDEYVRAMEVKK
jgi:hypothetical protein